MVRCNEDRLGQYSLYDHSCAKIFVENRNANVINTNIPTNPYVRDSDPVRATKTNKIQPTKRVTRYPTNNLNSLFIL
jgi:hypothetical protein